MILLPTALFWYHIYKNNLFANLHNWTSNKPHNSYSGLPVTIKRSETQLIVSYIYNPLFISLTSEDPQIGIGIGHSLLAVEHILVNCVDFDIIRQDFYTASDLKRSLT